MSDNLISDALTTGREVSTEPFEDFSEGIAEEITSLDAESSEEEEETVSEQEQKEEEVLTWEAVASTLREQGVTVDDILKAVKGQPQDEVGRNLNLLANDWGVEPAIAEARMSAVADYWAKLPKSEQARLDNLAGAKEIWGRLQKAQAASETVKSKRAPAAQAKPKFTAEQIEKMSPSERARRHSEILQAYAEGKVSS